MDELISISRIFITGWALCLLVAMLRHCVKTGRVIGMFELVGIVWRGDFTVKPRLPNDTTATGAQQ